MFDAPADSPEPVVPAESSARERMGLLRRMSEIGLRMAERLDRQSELAALRAEGEVLPEAARPEDVSRLDDMARSFAQVSRAVSVCIALEDRIERGGPVPRPVPGHVPAPQEGGRPFGPELVCPVPRESRLKTRRDQVQSVVRSAIDRDAHVAPGRVDDLCRRLDDILDREVAAVDAFLCRPVDEIIARICTRLGLEAELAVDVAEAEGFQRHAARGAIPSAPSFPGEGSEATEDPGTQLHALDASTVHRVERSDAGFSGLQRAGARLRPRMTSALGVGEADLPDNEILDNEILGRRVRPHPSSASAPRARSGAAP